MEKHTDRDYVSYILKGIEQGFRLGVNTSKVFQSAKKNMLSSRENPTVIEEYLQKEVEKGNILGPFPSSLASVVHINRFGVI